LSAGQLLRDETTKENSPHAALIEECLVAGKIVPVGISLALLRKAMEENEGKSVVFLVDGFPRNFDNLEGWAKCMRNVANVWGILVYQCPLSVLEARIMERAKDSGRSDDNLESLRKRFKTFELDTMPIIDTLRLLQENSSMKVFDIIGDQTLENVWGETQDCMNSLIANDVLAANQQLLEAVATENSELYRSLSAGEMFEGKSSEEVMYAQEGRNEFPAVSVLDAKLTFMSGKKVSVTYKRLSKTTTFKETRLWSYKTKSGWRTIHYSRSPC
jgi:UMP-CMP kinase